MKKIVKKLFWVWKQDEEKAFLEDMAQQGYRLDAVLFGTYIFDQQEEQKLIYQMDFRGIERKIPESEYLQIYEDAGWTLATKYGLWYYFYKPWEPAADLSIFNDNKSKRTMYKRLLAFLLIVGFPFYYQTLILFPSMPDAEFVFPSFYFFMRILLTALMVLHLLALVRVYLMYRKLKSNLRE